MQVKLRHQEEALRVVSAGHLLMAVWFEAPTIEDMKGLQVAGERHRTELRGERQVFVNVVAEGRPRLFDEIHGEATRQSSRNAPHRAATAHVILLSGFPGVMVRSFMSTMILLSRPRAPTRVFDSMGAAAPWLVERLRELDPAWTQEALHEVYRQARAR